MSTFTRIKTKTTIRDPEVMYRVLKSIPGAQIERNVLVSTIGHIIPSRVAFQVTLGNAAPSLGGLLGLVSLGDGVSSQRIYVRRSDNGTFTIEIGHENREAVNAMRSVVRAALATNMPSTGSRELGPQTDAAPAPPKREQERL